MPLPEDGSPEESVYDTPSQFSPYDPPTGVPESVQPTPPTSPDPSSEVAPGGGDTPGEDGEPQEAPQGPDGEQDPLPEFDPRYAEEFTGLLYLGRLQETFNRFGHTFVIRTLTTEQLAEIALIVKPYAGTNAENAVYQSAVVAASVVQVDGKPLPGAITMDGADHELTSMKFPYVQRNWMPAVREAVYDRCFDLELRARQVLNALGEASG